MEYVWRSACVTWMVVCLVACGQKASDEIEKELSPGVVLVQNKSYYEVKFDNGESLFFTNFDETGDPKGLAANEDSVVAATSFGTGFFVSDDGQIATNAHVVSATTDEKTIKKSMSQLISGMKILCQQGYNELYEKYETALQWVSLTYYSSEYTMSDYQSACALRDGLAAQLNELKAGYDALNMVNPQNCEINYHCDISIAYNDTYVTKESDFAGCVIVKTDKEHDLALLQLKNKKTPEDRTVFSLEEENPLKNYTFTEKVRKQLGSDKNENLYMISFNLGPTLALTEQGIKSQFNKGQVSQTSPTRIMYSIPSLHGSSGSPVVNGAEQVVAVNFAGIESTQSFNFGIPVKFLKRLMEE